MMNSKPILTIKQILEYLLFGSEMCFYGCLFIQAPIYSPFAPVCSTVNARVNGKKLLLL